MRELDLVACQPRGYKPPLWPVRTDWAVSTILDSSWCWLSPRERTVLSALAIFVGGFTREAAEAVADADLGERPMVRVAGDPGTDDQLGELLANERVP